MSLQQFNRELFDFLQCATTPFHAVEYMKAMLIDADFTQLHEQNRWQIKAESGYFCIRDNGTIIIWKTSREDKELSGWKMLAAHTDSPTLQIKPLPAKQTNSYMQLGVEIYGGPILASWFDRDLGIGGRVSLLTRSNDIVTRTVDFKRPVAIIPNLAIHLNRKINEDYSIERQKHLLPLFCQNITDDFSFHHVLRKQIEKEYPQESLQEILGFDLFCYDIQQPALTGLNDDFISAPRLDNLLSCFIGIKSILRDTSGNCLLLCSNHEEIGSSSVAGAQGNFLSSVLTRLVPDSTEHARMCSKSFFISMDNAHALHPNFTEKHDPLHLPLLNHGPVIKYNANQRYATTSNSAALFKKLCKEAGVPVQEFVMKNDLACGSTIGPIVATTLGIQTVDIGIPSLAMHSTRETTGVKDPHMLSKVISLFLSHSL